MKKSSLYSTDKFFLNSNLQKKICQIQLLPKNSPTVIGIRDGVGGTCPLCWNKFGQIFMHRILLFSVIFGADLFMENTLYTFGNILFWTFEQIHQAPKLFCSPTAMPTKSSVIANLKFAYSEFPSSHNKVID